IGRAPVSKTGGWGFEPLHSCQIKNPFGLSGRKDYSFPKHRAICDVIWFDGQLNMWLARKGNSIDARTHCD
ncbi:hypothetical protein OAH90_03230, partial [Alphaproteobacteria bacterium]|nr:hypothetical protein [Alphaproteobacteria bacterium]